MAKYRRVLCEVGTARWYSSGVRAFYSYRDRMIFLDGWYDAFVGIEPVEMTLQKFLQGLGITLEDCQEALSG